MLDQANWLFLFQMLQGVGQVGAVLAALYAVRLVQKYTREKDEADFIRNRWNEQTQLNLVCIHSDTALKSHEEIVYGEGVTVNLDLARKYFVIFSMLNQIQHLFIAINHRILTRAEFDTYALQTLRLLKRQEETVNYLLDERGYSDGFKAAIRPLFATVHAPNLPPASSVGPLAAPPIGSG